MEINWPDSEPQESDVTYAMKSFDGVIQLPRMDSEPIDQKVLQAAGNRMSDRMYVEIHTSFMRPLVHSKQRRVSPEDEKRIRQQAEMTMETICNRFWWKKTCKESSEHSDATEKSGS